jgi:hypothetical protein
MSGGRDELIVALTSTLGLEDLHDVLEVRRVDAYNDRVVRKWQEKQDRSR